MRIAMVLLALAAVAATSSAEEGWVPDWIEYEKMRDLDGAALRAKLFGRWDAEYVLMGWSAPRKAATCMIEIGLFGLVAAYARDPGSSTGFAPRPFAKGRIVLAKDHGSWTARSTLRATDGGLQGEAQTLSAAGIPALAGIVYVSKDGREIMFGNGIEADGGPAFVFRKE